MNRVLRRQGIEKLFELLPTDKGADFSTAGKQRDLSFDWPIAFLFIMFMC
jgi:hypothetical protein